MYSTASAAIDPQAPGVADLFATHAALALGKAEKVDQLSQALRTREVIGQAVGLLMQKYDLDTDAAFGFLVRTSSHSNTKVRDIAVRMVEDTKRRSARLADEPAQGLVGEGRPET